MTLKDKMKTYNFWISLVSAVVLLLRIIGDTYGFSVDSGLIMDITTGVCGIFVILGIISAPQKSTNNNASITETVKGEEKMESNNTENTSLEYKQIFETMNEKLQNNLNNIENMANSVEDRVEIIENISDEICENFVEVEDCKQEDIVIENDDEINSNDESIDLLKSDTNATTVLSDDVNVVDLDLNKTVEVESNIASNSQNIQTKLDEIIASLSIDEIQKLKSMI